MQSSPPAFLYQPRLTSTIYQLLPQITELKCPKQHHIYNGNIYNVMAADVWVNKMQQTTAVQRKPPTSVHDAVFLT